MRNVYKIKIIIINVIYDLLYIYEVIYIILMLKYKQKMTFYNKSSTTLR